ncbi:hypothetical protein AVEN_119223-1 [Araneus ventricosus]|uniref:Uncharacterized protein n=1 Tax=Araneus ventricosus TaxID=182803 RepID=A0A4Y2IL14_ARAVE|nr:hypothetical protein AVEN_119223-1 [Araneus ventricosus]
MFKCFKKILHGTEELCNASETIEIRGGAQTVLHAMCDFSFLCLLCLWNNVLKEVNHVQKCLKILGINFEKSVKEASRSPVFLKDKRNDLVEEAMQFAKDTCKEMGIPVVKRT